MIMFIDIIVILSAVFVINLFQKRYREYAKVFDKRNVEMRDFSVLISNLPFDHQYGGKDIILQALLWEHIEKRLQASFESIPLKNNNEVQLQQLRLQRPWEIADINFSKIDPVDAKTIRTLNQGHRLRKRKIHQRNQLQSGKDADKPETQAKI